MPNYSFLILSPFEFEELTRDILQIHYGIYLESFSTGKDKGIDFRYSKDWENNLIVQCKRYEKYNSLKNNLRNEFYKVEKLNPNKYILSTSAGLTPSNKDEIIKIFDGYIDKSSDIFGKDDLNNLLGQYSEIEKKYFKLWLPSTNILQRILHNDVATRSEFEEKSIKKDINIYVQNKSFPEAIEILNKFNYLIISGIPGIGKTILARILIFQYLSKGYELVAISSDIDEAENLYKRGAKQIFYYDDFLGRNFLEDSLKKNEDSRLVKFIERVKGNPNKKFIMTTREYILNQAKQKYEIFTDYRLEIAKCIIDLEKYSKLIRSKILYNHLFYSDLPFSYINALLINKNYLKIINHQNYNPRIIQFMTEKGKIDNILERDFSEYFVQNLNNPTNIWEHCFEHQISKPSKYLLYKLLISYEQIFKQDLENAFWVFYKDESSKFNFEISQNDFMNALRELENAFIKITKVQKREESTLSNSNKFIDLIEFQNPSIKDFLINKVKDNLALLSSLSDNAVFLIELLNIYRIYSTKRPLNELENDIFVSKLLNRLIKKFDKLEIVRMKSHYEGGGRNYWQVEYLTDIEKLHNVLSFSNLIEFEIITDFVIKKLSHYKNENKIKYYNKSILLNILIILKNNCRLDVKEYIKKYFVSIEDIDDITYLIEIINNFPEAYNEIFSEDRDVEDLEESLMNVINDEYDNICNGSTIDIDLVEELKTKIEKIEEHFEVDFQDMIIDLEQIIEDNPEDFDPSGYMDYGEAGGHSYVSEDKIIDNMFDSLR